MYWRIQPRIGKYGKGLRKIKRSVWLYSLCNPCSIECLQIVKSLSFLIFFRLEVLLLYFSLFNIPRFILHPYHLWICVISNCEPGTCAFVRNIPVIDKTFGKLPGETVNGQQLLVFVVHFNSLFTYK